MLLCVIEALFNCKNLIISFDSLTAFSFKSCPIYLLPSDDAPSNLPEKPENGSNISLYSFKYFDIMYFASIGLKIDTIFAVPEILKPLNILEGQRH